MFSVPPLERAAEIKHGPSYFFPGIAGRGGATRQTERNGQALKEQGVPG